MQKGDYLLQNFAMFVHLGKTADPFHYAMKLVDLFYNELEPYSDRIGIVKRWEDIEENQKAGKMSAMLTLEEGGICKGDLSCLRDFYRLGARMMTITWNFPNELGFPNGKDESVSPARSVPDTEHGLTETGIAFVQEMERIGMIIDISHLNDAGIRDVFHYTKKPFVASHSNARSVCASPRNLTDDMIRKLAERGGIAGINFYQHFLGEQNADESYLDLAVQHMKYMINLGGEDFVALGSDFDGINRYDDIPDCSVLPKLVQTMKTAGLTPTQIEKICYQNTLRIYRELL